MLQGVLQRLLAFSEPPPLLPSRLLPFLKRIRDLFAGLRRIEIFLIKGSTKNDNRSVTTLFIGGQDSASQFAFVAYSGGSEIVSLGKLLSFQIDPSRLPATDVKAICLRGPQVGKFLANGYLILPCVDFGLDLRTSMTGIFRRLSGRRRRDIKRLQRYHYSYTVCRKSNNNFDFFYWKMYFPYITKRFKTAAHTRGYFKAKACYRNNGGIIFVRREDKPVAGILFQIKRKTLYARNLGIYEGNQGFIRDLAGQAALLFLIEWAKEKGLSTLNYGATVPFMRDGTFQYKKEWGMFIEAEADQPFCILGINPMSENLLPFLVHNPFIFLDKGLMKAAVFVSHIPAEEELQQIYSRYFLPRLHSLLVLTYDTGLAKPTSEPKANATTQKDIGTFPEPIADVCRQLGRLGCNVQVLQYTRAPKHPLGR